MKLLVCLVAGVVLQGSVAKTEPQGRTYVLPGPGVWMTWDAAISDPFCGLGKLGPNGTARDKFMIAYPTIKRGELDTGLSEL